VRVDGGASDNNLLMQFQSDITNRFFYKSETTESTSLGAAFLAGLALGYWDSLESINDVWSFKSKYQPSMDSEYRLKLLNNWNKAISRSKNWEQE
jgi:glycerol kinase